MKYILILLAISLVTSSCSSVMLPPITSQRGSSQIPSLPNLINKFNMPPKPKLQRLKNGHYRVLQDWPVRVSGRRFVVQKGYTSNGITAPKSIKSMLGDNVRAPETWTAIFHDWCFTQKNMTRLQCDNYYIQLMRDFKISPVKIRLMGAAVKGYSAQKAN